MTKRKKTFVRHFRIYLKNNHPAYIVDEEGNLYVFHRVTHSKTSGGRKNWIITKNPIKGHNEPMYIVKQEKRDFKGRFSLFEIELKDGVDVSYPQIKKAGNLQATVALDYESRKALNQAKIKMAIKKLVRHRYIKVMIVQQMQPAHLLKQTRAKSTRRKK